jgi:hypothetical protein
VWLVTIKQPQNLNASGASAQTDATRARAAKPTLRPAPFQDDSAKDPKGQEREGFCKKFDATFGSGSFDASLNDSYSYTDGITNGSAAYGCITRDEEQRAENFRYFESSLKAAANNPLLNFDFNDTYSNSYPRVQSNIAYDATGRPYTVLDISDPYTRDAVTNSHMVYDDNGNPSFFMTDTSCAKPNGKTAEMYLAAKASLGDTPLDLKDENTRTMVAEATIDEETGLAVTDQMCVNESLTEKIKLGKAQLDGTAPSNEAIAAAAPQQSLAPDNVFIATNPLGPEQNPKFQQFMATSLGQGNDLFFATNAMANNDVLSRPTALSASAASPTPVVADIASPASPSAAIRQPAPAMAI